VKVSELGEFGLIDLINRLVNRQTGKQAISGKGLILGIGDDTAAWECRGKIQLATTDTLVQDVHFLPEYTSWEELGYKSIAVNLSDIAAMGGTPQYALVSLCVPGDLDVDSIEQLYRGMLNIGDKYNTVIAGGNITSSDKLVINVTVCGFTDNKVLTRSSARAGDKIAITGYTGLAKAGLMTAKHELKIDIKAQAIFNKAWNQPEPRIEFGRALMECRVNAATDISDGLIADLKHICGSSQVSARIDLGSIPVHPLLKQHFPDDYISMMLAGGEDYELLFTASDTVMKKVKTRLANNPYIIGAIETGDACTVNIFDSKGTKINIEDSGWDHFNSRINP
jgi:thiamine-monophosphate kinase